MNLGLAPTCPGRISGQAGKLTIIALVQRALLENRNGRRPELLEDQTQVKASPANVGFAVRVAPQGTCAVPIASFQQQWLLWHGFEITAATRQLFSLNQSLMVNFVNADIDRP